MNLVTFSESRSVLLKKSAGKRAISFEPMKPYVLSGRQLSSIEGMDEIKNPNVILKNSFLDPRIPNFTAYDYSKAGVTGGKLLLYCGSGGYGDQILAWPVAKHLAKIGYDVFVLVDPGNEKCWWCFPWIKDVIPLPVSYELFKMFDHYAMFEFLVNSDEHPDQDHPTERMFKKIGVDPNSVEEKVVEPFFTAEDDSAALTFIGKKKIAIYQLSASRPIRSFTPDKSAFILRRLAATFPEYDWIAVFDEFVPKPYFTEANTNKPDNVDVVNFRSLRHLFRIVKSAHVVVAPDSLMLHLAGVHGVPSVGIWGMTSPESRAKYYKNHVGIFKRKSCPMSPCHHAAEGWPAYCPPLKNREMCECVNDVTAEDVIESVHKILKSNV